VPASRGYVARIVGALLIALTVIIGASAADSAITPPQEQTFKSYVARVYSDPNAQGGGDAYFEILKDGKRVFVQRAKDKGERFFIGTMYKDDPDAGLVKMGTDITGNGQPDLVISEWSGYANCCLTIHIFEIGPTFKQLGTIDAEFGDSGPHFVQLDKNSKVAGLAIQIHDWTFANWNADFADSPAPKVLLRFSDGAYRVAPDLMRAPLPSAQDLEARTASIANYAPSTKGGRWPDADVSPQLWGTMLDLIYSGHTDNAWQFLDVSWPAKVHGKAIFERDFRKQLAKSLYWPALKGMNGAKQPRS
jgi:hypothetical protein